MKGRGSQDRSQATSPGVQLTGLGRELRSWLAWYDFSITTLASGRNITTPAWDYGMEVGRDFGHPDIRIVTLFS